MNTNIGYKLFRVRKSKPGKLFPLYVLSNEELPMGQWLRAKNGDMENGKVKSKLGPLKFRPGFHINDRVPYVTHIGVKTDGIISFMHPDTVWCEVEYQSDIDYNMEAEEYGWNDDRSKFRMSAACLDRVPEHGFYYYKTNPQMFGKWIIAGEMKINRILSDDEVCNLCAKEGLIALKHQDNFNIEDYGFVA